MPWLRLWTDILDDPDLCALPEEVFGAWCKFLVVAKRNTPQGQLLPHRKLAHVLHRDEPTVTRWINDLIAAGLIDEEGGHLTMHGWERWQEKEDRTNAKRQADWRERRRQQDPSPPLNNPPEEGDREGEGEVTKCNDVTTPLRSGVTGAPAVTLSDPNLGRVTRLAEELSGDVSWAIWAGQQFKLGHPAHAIEESLRVCVDSGKWDRRFAGGVLKRLAQEGYPVNAKRPTGATGTTGPTSKTYPVIQGP